MQTSPPEAAPGAAAPRPRVVLATHNLHKLREISAMVQAAPFELVSLESFPEVALPEETGTSFEENAIGKAAAAAAATGLAAIGDDSGLQVDALQGAPGIRSTRFAGPGATDEKNLWLLLERMQDVPDDRRSARFVCAVAVADPMQGTVQVVRGECEGAITRAPRGSGGFGYDPIFLIPGDGRTLAEFTAEEKNRISHRFRALRAALPLILAACQAY